MPASNSRGMSELIQLFDTLPAGAEDDIKQILPGAAESILALQKSDVPVRTGDLWRGLTMQILNGGLKVQAGLLGNTSGIGRAGLGALFYGRIVEGGRKAQTVWVERRRRVGGRLRTSRGRKIAADIVVAYSLPVKPMEARPFVDTAATEAVADHAAEDVAKAIQTRLQE